MLKLLQFDFADVSPLAKRVTRLNACFQRWIHTYIHASGPKKYEQQFLLSAAPEFLDGTYGIPSDESSRHFHNIELDARRRTSYVQTNNSPSMSFKGCLPSGAYCSDREVQREYARVRARASTAFASGMCIFLQRCTESNARFSYYEPSHFRV